MSENESPPSAVTAAFWLLVIGAVLLMAGGLMAATVTFDYLRENVPSTATDEAVRNYLQFSRGAGILFGFAGLALIWFGWRARAGDLRSRRAVIALGLTVVVLVAVVALFGFSTTLALLGVVPIIAGTLLLSRPSVLDWYAGA